MCEVSKKVMVGKVRVYTLIPAYHKQERAASPSFLTWQLVYGLAMFRNLRMLKVCLTIPVAVLSTSW